MASVNIVFNYPEEKIKKLDELAKKEGRSRSGLIQIILLKFLKSKGIEFSYEDLYESVENQRKGD
jgi:predicted amino acid racemase